ncbi:MAG: isochorismate synthase [Snowella sp.]|nr:isochorismate synthase [Snowella sp.]
MSVTVPVIPNLPNLLDNPSEIYRFLLTCQENFVKDFPQIISISQSIDALDPLILLATLNLENSVHFYWENCRNAEAMISYGIAKSIEINQGDRFAQSQAFIQDCFQSLIAIGEPITSLFAPRILSGFSFFDKNHPHSPFPSAFLFLPQIQILKKHNQFCLIVNFLLDKTVNLTLLTQQIGQQLQLLKKAQRNELIYPVLRDRCALNLQIHPLVNLQDSVTTILKLIESNHLSKLVIAQALDILSTEDFSILNCLQHLRQNYADCYVFSLSNGRGNCFLGASPERLISIQNQQLITDALAGSAPRGSTKQEDSLLANNLLQSEKERREHQAVLEYIMQQLQELGLSPQRSPLKLLKLSNIQHLWTPIYAQLKPNIHPLEIIARLHPTPAVAGVPAQVACAAIQEFENFDRSLYAAPLGWVDYHGNSEFIVGIRSALIRKNQARLYAGAGIVAGSDPVKELAEIELKLQALLNALNAES